MLEPWNDASILPPPVQTLAHNITYDVNELKDIIKSISNILNKQSPLHQESALMARFLYKFDKKFRNDLGYRTFKKVNTAMLKLLKFDFYKEVKSFSRLLGTSDHEVYLPSKQVLEYFIIKMLTFSKILLRINICSKQSAIFYLDRVKRGESHWMSLLPYSLLSRVWSISLILLQHTCDWYPSLVKFLDIVQKKGLDFLPDSYELPKDLHMWLDIDNLDSQGRFQWTIKKTLNIDWEMSNEEDDCTFESILGYVNQINDKVEDKKQVHHELKVEQSNSIAIQINKSTLPEDCGQKISRESFKGFFNTEVNKTNKQNYNLHSPANIVNKKSLHNFLITEENLRCEDINKALTSHLSFMQWQALKSSLSQLHESLRNNRKIEKKFSKIWKEKCSDYMN